MHEDVNPPLFYSEQHLSFRFCGKIDKTVNNGRKIRDKSANLIFV